jgi:tetratricopeptide (TPR) repeat protein/transcriptional regulator with XRE-family HTH domain
VDGVATATGTVSEQAFGAWLRHQRRAAGLTQEELAGRSGLSLRAISDFERGRTRQPHPRSLKILAESLGFPADVGEQWAARFRIDRTGPAGPEPEPAEPPGAPGQPDRPTHPAQPAPRQLPAPAAHFTGRTEQIKALTEVAARTDRAGRGSVVCVLGGIAGIGKTSLAVHFAHQVAGSFPDGQLHVNLRGFDPMLAPLAPAEAIRLVLDALAVPADRIPAGLDAQTGLYRSLLAARRVLIVLDNAADADQVRPLLPGGPDCLVLVTSRNRLSGLVALDGAVPVQLDVLTRAEAHALLARILGAARVSAEPEAVDRLIDACGFLPLALALTAARAATRPNLRLAALAGELADATRRLDLLHTTDDPLASVRAALACSYSHLDADTARTFRLLSVHPGPDISPAAAASLTGLAARQISRQLAELADVNLVAQDAVGRYSLHDLVRLYAAEQSNLVDSDTERLEVTRRLLDHYLHTGHGASLLLRPTRDVIDVDRPSSGTVPEDITEYGQALSWFDAERQVLMAVIGSGVAAGLDRRVWSIAWTLRDYLFYRGYWHEQIAVSNTALAAAHRLGDPALEGRSHYYLASDAAAHLGHYDDAQAHHHRALELFELLGDRTWQAHAHLGLAVAFEAEGRYAPALSHCRQALEVYIATDDLFRQATALNMIGWTLTQLGDYEQALTSCQQALSLSHKLGDRYNEAETLDSLGYVHHRLGNHAEAVSSYHQALDLCRELGHRYKVTETLTNLGDAHLAAHDVEAACDAWNQALVILDDLQHRNAELVRAKLKAAGAEPRI